jgi:tetratricopeptide (TPR) repeat protein
VRDVLVGRARELGEVTSVLDRARAGSGGLALVTGEPGIGKTRLVEEVAAQAGAAGVAVFWGTCFEDEGAPAYWVWAQLLRAHAASREDDQLAVELGPSAGFVLPLVPDLAGRLARMPPSMAGIEAEAHPGGQAARLPLFEAVVSVFRRAATRGPVLLVLDDLQWADASSLALLRFAAREVRRSPVAIVGTLRDVGAGPASGRMPAGLAETALTVPLAGLDATGVAVLVEQASGRPTDGRLAETFRRQTGGNPLFVIELSRLLAGAPPDEALAPALAGSKAVIERRLEALAPSCRSALVAASVIGAEFELELLVGLTGAKPQELADTLQEAVAARLIVGVGLVPGRYSFVHALVRDVLYESLLPRVRSGLHRKVGERLERRAGVSGAAELAHHFLRAGDHRKAPAYAEAAGRQALAVQAYEEAVVHFERALSTLAHAPGEQGRRVELLLGLGDARLRAGDLRAARAAFDEAAELARRRGSAEDLARAALGFGAGLGGFEVDPFDEHQIGLLEEALAVLDPSDSPLRAWTLARLSVALSFVASHIRRRQLSEEAVEMARRLDDRRALAYALASYCDAFAGPAHTEQRLRSADEIIQLAESERDAPAALLGRRLRLVARLELGDIAGVDADIDAFARQAEDLRQPLYLWYVPLWRAMRAMMQGRLDDAECYLVHAVATGERASSGNAVILTDSLRIQLALERGQPNEAEALLRHDVEQGLSLGPTAQAALASILARQDRRHEAQAIVDRLTLGGLGELPVEDGQWLNGMCRLADAAAQLGAVDAARVLYQRLVPYAGRFVVDGIGAACLGSVHGYLAGLAGTLGDDEARAEHLGAAVDAHRRTGSSGLLAPPRENGHTEATANVFRRDGDSWRLAFAGREVRVRDAKGLHDIAVLLAAPGRQIPVGDLVALDGGALPRAAGTGEIVDARARAAYRARLSDLREELDEAERFRDAERANRIRIEIDALTDALAAALGIGGLPRQWDDPAERARKAVTRRIRHTIGRLAPRHPELAGHLAHSIRTGRFCSYAPEHLTPWVL